MLVGGSLSDVISWPLDAKRLLKTLRFDFNG